MEASKPYVTAKYKSQQCQSAKAHQQTSKTDSKEEKANHPANKKKPKIDNIMVSQNKPHELDFDAEYPSPP